MSGWTRELVLEALRAPVYGMGAKARGLMTGEAVRVVERWRREGDGARVLTDAELDGMAAALNEAASPAKSG